MFKEGQKFRVAVGSKDSPLPYAEGEEVTVNRVEFDKAVTEDEMVLHEEDVIQGYVVLIDDAPNRYTSATGDLWATVGGFFADQSMIDHHRINAIEYIIRCYDKGGVEDLEKAVVNLNRAIEKMKEHDNG